MPLTIYGIPNCSSIKKALDYYRQIGRDYDFHDYKKQGVSKSLLDHWLTKTNWETLLNRQGTTWRNLPDDVKNSVNDATSAKRVMLDHPSSIKRPVIDDDGHIQVGLTDSMRNTA